MSLSVAPSPSSGRGEVILQPAYFTSSTFVHPARADVDHLLQDYSRRYAHARERPFALFKNVWQAHGWTWIQFKVFDARSRAAFLRVVMRLFAERIGGGETPLNGAAALFGLYAVLRTQPSASAPSLCSVAQVQMTSDLYEEMMALPDALGGEFLLPIRPHVVYVQSKLLEGQVFEILPHSEMRPLNPRALPREVVVGDDEVATMRRKGKGRPSKRERAVAARVSLAALDGVCGDVLEPGPSPTRERYEAIKGELVEATAGGDALRAASALVVERLSAQRLL